LKLLCGFPAFKIFIYTICSLLFFVNIFFQYLEKILGRIAHNVPAVYDGLAARIEKCVAFLGPTNCAGATAWEWSVAE
jgi:hypothetical protein